MSQYERILPDANAPDYEVLQRDHHNNNHAKSPHSPYNKNASPYEPSPCRSPVEKERRRSRERKREPKKKRGHWVRVKKIIEKRRVKRRVRDETTGESMESEEEEEPRRRGVKCCCCHCSKCLCGSLIGVGVFFALLIIALVIILTLHGLGKTSFIPGLQEALWKTFKKED